MAEMIYVQCPCGREYNAGLLDRCPACATPSRGATALDAPDRLRTANGPTTPSRASSSGVEQQMLAEMRAQTQHLKTIKNIAWSFWGVVFVGLAFGLIVSLTAN